MATVAKTEKIQSFVNDSLRNDLKRYDEFLIRNNEAHSEYMALQKFAENIDPYIVDGFKTKVNIGGNFFMQAKIEKDDMDKILVNIGLDTYIEFTRAEAIKFCKFKIDVLEKEADVIREQSVQTRAHIKLAMLCLTDMH